MTYDPDWQEYCGKLSEKYPATVIEHYTDKLVYAEMDVNGDDTLDLSIFLSDAGNEVDFVFPENITVKDYIRQTHGNIYRQERPQSKIAHPILISLYLAATTQSSFSKNLEILYEDNATETQRWAAAVALFLDKEETLRILPIVYHKLITCQRPRQSAFILTGHGKDGVWLLGKALEETDSNMSAWTSAIYLSDLGSRAKPAISSLLISLHKDPKNRRSVLSALYAIAKESPQLIAPYVAQIEPFASSYDDDISRSAKGILAFIANMKDKKIISE